MGDCCSLNKVDFLKAKATNFKAFLESFNPDAEVKAYIANFKPETLIDTITTIVIPIVQLKQIDNSIDELMKHLEVPETQTETVKTKLRAYLQMFNDVLLS